jgi:hypothetical protein
VSLIRSKVLWVEDSARFDLASLLGPIYASRRFDLTLAENATAASAQLLRRRFDAIVVDIRLPPGEHPYWNNIFKSAGADRANAKLGLALLGWLFGAAVPGAPKPLGNGQSVPRLPEWKVRPQQIGVFSVESRLEIGHTLEQVGVTIMHEKRPGLPDTILRQIIVEVLAQADRSDPDGSGPPGAPGAPGARGTLQAVR